MDQYIPVPFQIVDSPQQLKAFTDPLRIRILDLLQEEAATNQQLADGLGEPQAKVLYHLRALLDAELIVLVEQRVRGGNVEKYYRAVARMFGLRPASGRNAEQIVAAVDAIGQEVAASSAAWPELPIGWETRRARLAPERAEEFYARLNTLIAEYWGGPEGAAPEDPTAPRQCLAVVRYRDPTGPLAGADAAASDDSPA
jgi:DNA-binding transcriptional ArsR family regulator